MGFTECGKITLVAGEALAARRRVKLSGATVVYSDAGEEFIGVTEYGVANGADVALRIRTDAGSFEVTAAGPIAAGAKIYGALDGKVAADVVGGCNGYAIEAATADGDIIEVLLCGADVTSLSTEPVVLMEDFLTGVTEDGHKFSESADKADWLKSSTDGGPDQADVCKVADDGPGGLLQLTCNDANADLESIQMNGESIKLATGKAVYFETKVALLDVDKCDFFIGLAIADTGILGGVTDRVGFENLHDGNLKALIEQDNTEYNVDTTVDLLDCSAIGNFATKAVKLGFLWDGAGKVYFLVNDVLKVTMTDNGTTIVVPDDEALSPVCEIKTHTGAAAVQTAWIDYVKVRADR